MVPKSKIALFSSLKIHQIRLLPKVQGQAVVVFFGRDTWGGMTEQFLYNIEGDALLDQVG